MADRSNHKDDYVLYPPNCSPHSKMVLPCVRSRGGKAEAGFMAPSGIEPPENVEVETVRLEHVGKGVAKITEVVSGPAKVNSQAYRDGWENIFGTKRVVGDA